MKIHTIKISNEIQQSVHNIKNHIHELFYKQVIEPEYNRGYFTNWIKSDSEYDEYINTIFYYITYELIKDEEFESITERLQIGL